MANKRSNGELPKVLDQISRSSNREPRGSSTTSTLHTGPSKQSFCTAKSFVSWTLLEKKLRTLPRSSLAASRGLGGSRCGRRVSLPEKPLAGLVAEHHNRARRRHLPHARQRARKQPRRASVLHNAPHHVERAGCLARRGRWPVFAT